jgi:hypothetical protein
MADDPIREELNIFEIFGEPLSVYTRADAIEDGMLIDVSQLAREAGFKIPVAMTRGAWTDLVEWDEEQHGAHQDETGRLWDVLNVLHWQIKARGPGGESRLDTHVLRVPTKHPDARAQRANFYAQCGPGDDAEPVITILLPGED